MKILPEHLNILTNLIKPLDTPERRERYKQGDFPRADRVKDLNKRYRWDLYWDATVGDTHRSLRDALWDYMDDTHHDTALRNIVPKLEN